MKFDGIVPTNSNIADYIVQQHVMRYVFAKDYAKNKIVLDVACGAGYGTHYLAQSGALKVYGVDIDKNALKIAKTYYPHRRVEYIRGDVLSLPFKDEFFDLVVSFETIEHLRNPCEYIKEIKRVLKSGGIFICSTPNIKYTTHPPYHLHEFYPDKFFKFMKCEFNYVEKYGQYISKIQRFEDILGIKSKVAIVLNLLKNFLAKNKKAICEPIKVESLDFRKLMQNRVQIIQKSGILRIMICVCRK